MLRRTDNDTLRALVDGTDLPEGPSRLILDAYEHFQDLLKNADPDHIYRGVSQLNIVDVTLQRGHDDPQVIFESLNAKGVHLTQSDLIRNFMLMRLPEADQTRLYHQYWSRVENHFQSTNRGLDRFLRDYTALTRGESGLIRDDLIYDTFKRTFSITERTTDTEDRLADLSKMARFYSAFYVSPPKGETVLTQALRSLRRLGSGPALLVMRLYDLHDRGGLSVAGFVNALTLIESYVVRRAICDLSARQYWSIFARLAFRLSVRTPLSDLRVAFARLQGAEEFPSNRSFAAALREGNLYHRRVCWHLLARLENWGQREPSPTEDYSIEHIMPQNENLRREWREMLGGEWRQAHETWRHRLGNLTLTAYNSRYSDRSFEYKRTVEGGFKQSAVRLNEDVRDEAEWTVDRIENRGRRLAKRAVRIWPTVGADPELVKADSVRELRERAARRPVESLVMVEVAERLLSDLRERIERLGEVIFVVERKSICCYKDGELFLEALPQKWGIKLLCEVEYSEADDPDGLACDATQWKFIPNVAHRGWALFVDLSDDSDVPGVMPMVRQAFDLVRR